MYAPKQFREERQDVLVAAIRSIQFGTLVVSGSAELEVVHLPMMVRQEAAQIVLEGHVAAGNPFWKIAEAGTQALAIFQGPQAYVHPGWYETKRATGKAVPTWNYVAVHAKGPLSVHRDRDWLLQHVRKLTDRNEAGRAEPWAVSDAPNDYIEALLRGIVGIELAVERIEGVWKLIQHHSDANRHGVIAGLSASDAPNDQALAAAMRNREQERSAYRNETEE